MILSYGKRAAISLLALWLAACSAPPQTIRTPPDAVYHLDQGDLIPLVQMINGIRRRSDRLRWRRTARQP